MGRKLQRIECRLRGRQICQDKWDWRRSRDIWSRRLNILNAAAGAFTEHAPLIVISGAPPARSRESGALVHHLVSNYYLQFEIFRKVTADAAILMDPNTVPDEIDCVITSYISRKTPVYLEIPSDIVYVPCRLPQKLHDPAPLFSDEESLLE